MKTTFKLVIAITLFALNSNNFAYGKSVKSNRFETQQNLVMSFFDTDTVLVVVPDTYSLADTDNSEIECNLKAGTEFSKPVYFYKNESEVTVKDMKKHVLFFGSFYCFNKNNISEIPIKKTKKGFRFKKQVFEQPMEAFYYVSQNAKRMYVCKNSNEVKINFYSFGLGKYSFHVFRGNDILLTGVYL